MTAVKPHLAWSFLSHRPASKLQLVGRQAVPVCVVCVCDGVIVSVGLCPWWEGIYVALTVLALS